MFKSIFKAVYRKTIHPIMIKRMTAISDKIPKTDLDDKHVKNTRLLKNRKELIKLMPKNGVVAELGVNKGDFSQLILDITRPKKFHLIDFWGSARYNQKIRKHVEDRFADQLKDKSMEINLGLSTDVVNDFGDNYFDWIYIDTAHTYGVTRDELELYRTKMKDNGIIAGHDYIVGNWNGMVRYGVIESVHEFCAKYDWEIIYITAELTNNPSFAIRKITSV